MNLSQNTCKLTIRTHKEERKTIFGEEQHVRKKQKGGGREKKKEQQEEEVEVKEEGEDREE